MKQKHKNYKTSIERIEEIRLMCEEGDRNKELELGLFEGQEEDFESLNNFDLYVHNPDASWTVFYKIQGLMKKNLSHLSKKTRELIYEEKNIFLNRGKRKNSNGKRGSDGRMSFRHSEMETALTIVESWLKDFKSGGRGTFGLLKDFRELNEKMGYYDDTNAE